VAPAEPAPIANVHRLCARHVGRWWPGQSPRGVLLWRWDRVGNVGGESLLGGEAGEMAPSIWEIVWKWDFLGVHQAGEGRDSGPVLLKPRGKSAVWTGVVGLVGVPGVWGC